MYAQNLGKLQSVLVGAMRCLECHDQRCVNLCPEHVDVPAAMSLILSRSGRGSGSWAISPDQAAASAADGVEASFEG